jgi:hypothetical protein
MTEDDTDRYATPMSIMDRVYEVFENWPDLEPFSDPTSIVQAYTRWDIRQGQDAYELLWPSDASIFVNGPFSQCAKWLKLCHDAYQRGASVIAVCRTATSSDYWKRYVFGSTSRCYCQPRIKFDWNCRVWGSPREDHTVLCYSHLDEMHVRFAQQFGSRGWIENDHSDSALLAKMRKHNELMSSWLALQEKTGPDAKN